MGATMHKHSIIQTTLLALLLAANASFAQLSRYGMDAQPYQAGAEKQSLLENLGLGSGKKPEVSQMPGSGSVLSDIVNGGGSTSSGSGNNSSGSGGTGSSGSSSGSSGSSGSSTSSSGSGSSGSGSSGAGQSGGSCTASTTGAPCGGSGPASQGNGSGTNQGAGNPINVINGNKYQQEVDMPALPGVLGLEIVRHYNSKLSGPDTRPGLVGRGWRLSYETYLIVQSKWTIDIIQADGTYSRFERTPTNMKQYIGAGGIVTTSANSVDTEHQWQWPDGRALLFNGQGKLVQIQAPTGEFVSLQYDPRGWLSKVTDPQNRVLNLIYLDSATKQTSIAKGEPKFSGLQSIQSPLGVFSYQYGIAKTQSMNIAANELTANLVKVIKPSGSQWLYHYEDARHPTLLSGITLNGKGFDGVEVTQRLSTYGYDDKGRANLSVKGEPALLAIDEKTKQVLLPKRLAAGTGVEQVTLVWPKSGTSIVTNSLGQDTHYQFTRINGQDRITQVRGVGCANCGPVNIRYGYDAAGKLIETTQLDFLGKPILGTKTEFDTLGRITAVIPVAYVDGKPKTMQWQIRYEYEGQSSQPSLVAKPSVFKGKEHQLRFVYNDRRQVVQMTETGFSPNADVGEIQKDIAVPIARATTYGYKLINNRSLLVRIDGPLPNGATNDPSDSDITLLDYDSTGSWLSKITKPGGQFSQVSFNALGLAKKVISHKNDATEFEYNKDARLTQTITHRAGWFAPTIEQTQYDVFGQVAQVASGAEGAPNFRPVLRQSYDAQGRLIWSADLSGEIRQHRFDTEGRVIETGKYTNNIAQVKRTRYNPYGQPIHEIDNALRQVSYGYTAAGDLEFIVDPAGRLNSFSQSAAIESAQRPTSLDWVDDFGRVVAVTSVDTGLSLRQYDAADRLVAMRDAMGRKASYEYDIRGRMIRQVLAVGQPDEVVTTWRYEGDHLVAVDHPNQSEQFAYDARGLRTLKTVVIKPNVTITTRYEYDANGVLHAQSMADGSRIVYERDKLGQITKIKRDLIQTDWLRAFRKEQVIAENIQRDAVGLSSFTTGNGIQTSFQRSPQGILARVVHRQTGTRAQRTMTRASDKQLGWPRHWPSEWDWGQHRLVDTLMGLVVSTAVAAPAQGEPTKSHARIDGLGAMDLPNEENAIVDHRHLWDPLGNLAHTKETSTSAKKPIQTEYAYDHANRLIQANASTLSAELKQVSVEPSIKNAPLNDQGTYRYFYKNNKRVLAQEPSLNGELGITKISNLNERNHRSKFVNEAAKYSDDGMPTEIAKRQYQWDAAGRLVQISKSAEAEKQVVIANYKYDHRGLRNTKETPGEKTLYAYDDQRQLTTEIGKNSKVTRQYIYIGSLPAVQIDSPNGAELNSEHQGQLATFWKDIKTIAMSIFTFGHEIDPNAEPQMLWIHTNHLSAPLAATDANAQTQWQADYAPFGAAKTKSKNLQLEIRLPGQYHDKESGLHYNRQRYYDPARGEYLSPDPLGNPDGPNGYAYVNYNPLRYVDADGLTLFAFDGTENSYNLAWLTSGGRDSSLSNVAKFRDAYGDGVARYVSGVGTDHIGDQGVSDGYKAILAADYKGRVAGVSLEDRAGNYSGPARIARMQLYFNDEVAKLKKNEIMQVDIVGFSRGAAEARDFSNRIVAATKNGVYTYQLHDDKGDVIVDKATGKASTACALVNFRFMGLWDTVLSTNFSKDEKGKPYAYQLSIPSDFKYVAHAVALNEYRSAPSGVNATLASGGVLGNLSFWDSTRPHIDGDGHYGGFPLESIGASNSTSGRTRIELGFLGAHADVGGGYGQNDSGLATVALSWMVQQAKLAGVNSLKSIDPIDMNNPIVHDQSNAMQHGSADIALRQGFNVEDRQVVGAFSGSSARSMGFNFGQGTPTNRSLTNAEIEKQKFINYVARDGGGIDFRSRFDKRVAPIEALKNRTGNVNMTEYMKWLRDHGYQFYGD
jgi:RHS repeat-associated protein